MANKISPEYQETAKYIVRNVITEEEAKATLYALLSTVVAHVDGDPLSYVAHTLHETRSLDYDFFGGEKSLDFFRRNAETLDGK